MYIATMEGRAETYYGVVFGVRGQTWHTDHLTFENNKYVRISDLASEEWKRFWTTVGRIHNCAEESLLTYHDGDADVNGCQYNGHHFHWVVRLRCHPTRDCRWGRDLLSFSKGSGGVAFFASQVARVASALQKHILKAPRQLVAVKGPESTSNVGKTTKEENGTSTLSTEVAFQGRVKKEAAWYRIDFLITQMKYFRTADIQSLKAKVIKDPKLWATWREMQASANFETLCKKAIETYRTERCHMSFEDMLLDYSGYIKTMVPRHMENEYYDVTTSKVLFRKWLDHQEFEEPTFMADLFNVLEKKLPKKNTFVLQGRPNAGKSWVLRSLVPLFMFYGEVRAGDSYNFMWQDCLDCSLLFIEEIMVTDKIVEQCKLIFEGAETYVHVKQRGDALLTRTPVLITCNSPIWKWCMQEKEALQARMYVRYCKTTPWLKDYHKKLNPLMWTELYDEWTMRWNTCHLPQIDDKDEFENQTPSQEELMMLAAHMAEVDNDQKNADAWLEDGGNKMPDTPPCGQRSPIMIPDTPLRQPPKKRLRFEMKRSDSLADIFNGDYSVTTASHPLSPIKITFDNTVACSDQIEQCERYGIPITFIRSCDDDGTVDN